MPDMPNVNNMAIIIGHRFGQQPSLDKSSRRNSTIFCMQFSYASMVRFPKYVNTLDENNDFQQMSFLKRACLEHTHTKENAPVASLKRRKWGLGIATHKKI